MKKQYRPVVEAEDLFRANVNAQQLHEAYRYAVEQRNRLARRLLNRYYGNALAEAVGVTGTQISQWANASRNSKYPYKHEVEVDKMHRRAMNWGSFLTRVSEDG